MFRGEICGCLHPTLKNVAKLPEQITLLLNIGSGVFCWGKEINNGKENVEEAFQTVLEERSKCRSKLHAQAGRKTGVQKSQTTKSNTGGVSKSMT